MATGPSPRATILLLCGGLIGLAAFAALYRRAFPQAAVTLAVTRSEALERARAVLDSVGGPSLRDYRQAGVFDGNTVALVFLQRTLGLDEAGRWAREEVPIWSWSLRWFKPAQKEEWRASVGVDGRLVVIEHRLEDAAPGANLPSDGAQSTAEAFIRQRGWNLSDLELVESSSTKREHRTDHHFTWEKRGSTIEWRREDPTAGTGAIRVSVDVLGEEVGGYKQFLKVPEQFDRSLERTMSVGGLIAGGSAALMFILVLIALGLGIARTRQGQVQWRPAVVLGAAVALLFVAGAATSWPVVKHGYPTELDWATFVGLLILGLTFGALLYAVWVVVTAAAGESLGRDQFPEALDGFGDAIRGRLITPAMARASLHGYALGFMLLGYLTVFYVAAQRWLGAWLPAEGPYSEIFDHAMPFLVPLVVGLVAALSEELTFRLFGISLVSRYVKSTTLALLVPAVIWALGHSSYPVFPVYIRGIELTIVGVILGIAFLRLGILTCIVAHFVVNVVLVGLPLLTSGNPSYVASGVAVMGIALIPASLAWLGRNPPT